MSAGWTAFERRSPRIAPTRTDEVVAIASEPCGSPQNRVHDMLVGLSGGVVVPELIEVVGVLAAVAGGDVSALCLRVVDQAAQDFHTINERSRKMEGILNWEEEGLRNRIPPAVQFLPPFAVFLDRVM